MDILTMLLLMLLIVLAHYLVNFFIVSGRVIKGVQNLPKCDDSVKHVVRRGSDVSQGMVETPDGKRLIPNSRISTTFLKNMSD